MAHSDRFGGTWLPTRHEDVAAIAYDTDNYTSRGVIVAPNRPEEPPPLGPAPPITSDPPAHAEAQAPALAGVLTEGDRQLGRTPPETCAGN